MERKPEAISRLLRGEGSNPTLDTLIDLVDAIGLELDIRIRRLSAADGEHVELVSARSTAQ